MKKILALILCVLTLLPAALTGCGDGDVTDEEAETTIKTSETENVAPYEFVYESLGNGKCEIVRIIFNETDFDNETIVVPSVSPEGETVTVFSAEFGYPFPMWILKEDFDNEIMPKLQAGLSERDFERTMAFFTLMDPNDCATDTMKEALYSKYPITRESPIYVFADDAKESERQRIHETFNNCGITDELIVSLVEKTGYEINVTICPPGIVDVVLPDTVEEDKSNIKQYFHAS